ncbi:MAG: hypothetical protein WDO15_30840 [Bacteroidota bacterium]
MVWLMRILNSYENDQLRAFQIADFLHKTYPDNPYFHRYYARMLYSRGMYVELGTRIEAGSCSYRQWNGWL